MSTIGYGDAANPNTTAERAMGILCMLVGSGLYGYILGAIWIPKFCIETNEITNRCSSVLKYDLPGSTMYVFSAIQY